MEKRFNKIFILLLIGGLLTIFLVIIGLREYLNPAENLGCGVESPPEAYCGTTDYSKAIQGGIVFNGTGERLFKDNCAPCHDIGVVKVGPRLKNINKVHSRSWLQKFIKNSEKLMESKDKEAISVYKEYDGMMMPSYEFLSESQIDSILAHIEFESAIRK